MKKHLLKSVCLSALASFTFMARMPAEAARPLRLSLQGNTKHPVGANIVYFKEQLEKLSNGEMKVELYDSAQLFKGSEVPQAVSSGAIDMGLVLIDEYAGTLPATGLFSVAFMFPSYEVLAKAASYDSPVRKEIDELIRSTGTRVVWWQDYGPVQLLGKGEKLIVNPEDIDRKSTRLNSS